MKVASGALNFDQPRRHQFARVVRNGGRADVESIHQRLQGTAFHAAAATLDQLLVHGQAVGVGQGAESSSQSALIGSWTRHGNELLRKDVLPFYPIRYFDKYRNIK